MSKTDCTKLKCQFMNPSECELYEECPDYTRSVDILNIFDVYAIKLWLQNEYNCFVSILELCEIIKKVGYNNNDVLMEIRSNAKLMG